MSLPGGWKYPISADVKQSYSYQPKLDYKFFLSLMNYIILSLFRVTFNAVERQ